MARFFGRYEHSLDPKGRVILPVKFRPPFEHGGYLSQFYEGCLALWTPEAFDRRLVQLEEAANEGRAERNQARMVSSSSFEVEVDRQGRMAIPARLREFARLEGDVLVIGAIDRVELWDAALWEEKLLPEERRLMGEDDS